MGIYRPMDSLEKILIPAVEGSPADFDFSNLIIKEAPSSVTLRELREGSGIICSNYYPSPGPTALDWDEVVDLVVDDGGGLGQLRERERQLEDSELQSRPWMGLTRLLVELPSPQDEHDDVSDEADDRRLAGAWRDIRLGLDGLPPQELYALVQGILAEPAPLLRCRRYGSRRQALLALVWTSWIGEVSARDADVSRRLFDTIKELQGPDVWRKGPLDPAAEKRAGRAAASCALSFWLEADQRRSALALAGLAARELAARKLAATSELDVQERLVCLLVHAMDLTLALGVFGDALQELFDTLRDKAVRRVLRHGDRELRRLLHVRRSA